MNSYCEFFFESMHFSPGAHAQMTKCTSTAVHVMAYPNGEDNGGDASLVVEDCRGFGGCGYGVGGYGHITATRCTIEDYRGNGVSVYGGESKFVECVVRNNALDGLKVEQGGTVSLVVSTISGNKGCRVLVRAGSSVTVAQTVSSANLVHDRSTLDSGDGVPGEIPGLAKGIKVVENVLHFVLCSLNHSISFNLLRLALLLRLAPPRELTPPPRRATRLHRLAALAALKSAVHTAPRALCGVHDPPRADVVAVAPRRRALRAIYLG